MEAVKLALFGLFGLVFGSFLTAVVHRMPQHISIVRPRSACPRCGAQLRARDNIPLVSYIALRGRCHGCHLPISAEYPAVEALTGALFVAAALAISDVWVAALVAPFLGVLFAAALIDMRHRIIPNRLLLPSMLVFAVAIVALAVAGRSVHPFTAVLAMLAYGGALLVVALVSGGMGMGDIKLAALIGLVLGALGWAHVGVAAFGGIVFGGIGALVALMLGKSRKDAIPFGPYLAGGALVAVLAGPQIAAWYGSVAV